MAVLVLSHQKKLGHGDVYNLCSNPRPLACSRLLASAPMHAKDAHIDRAVHQPKPTHTS